MQISKLKRFWGNSVNISLGNKEQVVTIALLSHKSPDSIINVQSEFGDGEGKVP